MKLFNQIKELYQDCTPEKYISPGDLGISCTYEVKKGMIVPSKHDRIAGFKMEEINSIDKLYGLVHPSDIDQVLKYSIRSISYMNSHGVKLLEHQSEIIFRAIGKGGKLYYLRRHGAVNGIIDNQLVCSFTLMHDVTWMRPTPCSWKLSGPNTEGFDFELPEIANFENTLSKRELEVLRLVAKGFQSRDIAEILRISKHTVDTHRRNMVRRLDVANSPELVSLARDMALI